MSPVKPKPSSVTSVPTCPLDGIAEYTVMAEVATGTGDGVGFGFGFGAGGFELVVPDALPGHGAK